MSYSERRLQPPMRRSGGDEWLYDDPQKDVRALYQGQGYADPGSVGHYRQDLWNSDHYEEPDEYYRDEPIEHDHGPSEPSLLGVSAGGGGGDMGDDPDYGSYFDDDDNMDELVDRTSDITRNALEWAVVLVGAVLIALLLRLLLFQAYYIPSESMESTLSVNDRVVVNKFSYRLEEINRGDIVVFARPDEQQGPIKDLIKRVVGLPGDRVEARDNTVYVNGQRMIEPYLDPGTVTDDFGPTIVPEGEIFVMGDNRRQSFDSRRFGTVAQDRVVGRAFVLFWPLNRVGPL